MPKIELKNVYKIFGEEPQSVLPLIKNGSTKEEILEDTDHTVGLDNFRMYGVLRFGKINADPTYQPLD